MRKKPIYGGWHYKEASRELATVPFGGLCVDYLNDGRHNRDLYCISMIYDRYFDVNSEYAEDLCNMLSDLEIGRDARFWVSYYQSADLLLKLENSKFRGLTCFGSKSIDFRLHLLQGAKSNFCEVPIDVSTISLLQIEQEIFLEVVKNGGSL